MDDLWHANNRGRTIEALYCAFSLVWKQRAICDGVVSVEDKTVTRHASTS